MIQGSIKNIPNSRKRAPKGSSRLRRLVVVIHPRVIVSLASRAAKVESSVPTSTNRLCFPKVESCTSHVDEFASRNQVIIALDHFRRVYLENVTKNIIAALERIQIPVKPIMLRSGVFIRVDW